ncbi:hypothetical protein K470DRAFT_209821 [Piedraia hortae CBS 480.64]|uniref:RRM domain-containing protein n=1 Tax=Piedraia hortae CBS 480.64 TaxID=1314780 RepID=A0A6A7C8R7_9PEZI|nr:hypothetical protein K470DRAFT_209821 [Piedraia hortae CBS 480.64]
MSSTVQVSGISSQTSEKEIRDFFSFCGKIQSLSVKPESGDGTGTQTATVTFEKEAAAKTAQLLDNTQLGPSQVHVTSSAPTGEQTGVSEKGAADSASPDMPDIPQEEKPRARIVAEYLAQGYVLSDQVLQRALQMDQQHGISQKFTAALRDFDNKYHATSRAQVLDNKYGITARANEGWRGLTSYFEKASNTPTGQRLRAFYNQGQKQVLDVHNEAKHLASLKKSGEGQSCNCGGDSTKCTCVGGQCKCNTCGKNTTCDCGGDASKCKCQTQEGKKCLCKDCPKSTA